MSTTSPIRGAHLVGSVPLTDAEGVFRTVSSALGSRLRRLPDGETGERSEWIMWQWDALKDSPGLLPAVDANSAYGTRPQVKPRPGLSAEEVEINPLGYATSAIGSYQLFAQLKQEGVIPGHLRFQISLPTPLAPVTAFVAQEDRLLVEPAYEAAMLREVAEIVAAIPHGDLAIQWDMAREFAILEGVSQPHFSDPEEGIRDRVVRLSSAVPEDVEIGYHLCYGDFGHRHFAQPKDANHLKNMANTISDHVQRPIAWIHFPVPVDRHDEAYFEPLREVRLHSETELYVGLIHHSDGVEGARRRIETAQQVLGDFGVGTECGWGRRPVGTIPELLRIHAEVSEPLV
jgi:hypothetical protein